jgi:U3 small nucleolar RNA-associated protein 18
VELEAALRSQHSKLNPRTKWARKGAKEDTAAQDLMHQTGPLSAKSLRLAPGRLEVSRLKDANHTDPHVSVISSVEFHPYMGQLMTTAGLDKKLKLFQVDGVRNPRVSSIFLEDCPIHKASFAMDGKQIIATGRRPFFYLFDVAASKIDRIQGPRIGGSVMSSLESFAVSAGEGSSLTAFLGDQGLIQLVSLKSKQWIANLKMSGTVRSAVFSSNGNELITGGGDGVLYTWDLRTRKCVGQMTDLGNKDSSSLALSSDGKYLATGSASGVVNLYDHQIPQSHSMPTGTMRRPSSQKPLKELMNLTTTIDSLAFSHDSQILAMGSRMKKDAMRLVHLPSMTAFSNWPTSRSPLNFVHSLAFSPNSGYLAVGNARGKVLLYRISHYQDV